MSDLGGAGTTEVTSAGDIESCDTSAAAASTVRDKPCISPLSVLGDGPLQMELAAGPLCYEPARIVSLQWLSIHMYMLYFWLVICWCICFAARGSPRRCMQSRNQPILTYSLVFASLRATRASNVGCLLMITLVR